MSNPVCLSIDYSITIPLYQWSTMINGKQWDFLARIEHHDPTEVAHWRTKAHQYFRAIKARDNATILELEESCP